MTVGFSDRRGRMSTARWRLGDPDDLPPIVDCSRVTLVAAEGAELDEGGRSGPSPRKL